MLDQVSEWIHTVRTLVIVLGVIAIIIGGFIYGIGWIKQIILIFLFVLIVFGVFIIPNF